MAQITKIQAADRTVTQTRGRVMRKFEKVRGERPSSTERRRVCVLSVGSAYALEQYEIGEPCYGDGCRHVHLTRSARKLKKITASSSRITARGTGDFPGAGSVVMTAGTMNSSVTPFS